MAIYVGGVLNSAAVARRVIGKDGASGYDGDVIELAQKVAAELVVAGWDPVRIVDAPTRAVALAGGGIILFAIDSN